MINIYFPVFSQKIEAACFSLYFAFTFPFVDMKHV
jgi:hypothetical protein